MKGLWNQKGFTVVELIVAMAVLAILGAAVSGLVRTGLSAYARVSDTHYTETEARTALSLVTTQLRKHDATGAIEVVTGQHLGLRDDPAGEDKEAGIVIWFESGTVYTAQTADINLLPSMDIATPIAQVYGLTVTEEATADSMGLAYKVTVSFGAEGEKQLSQTVTQRSAAAPRVEP